MYRYYVAVCSVTAATVNTNTVDDNDDGFGKELNCY